MCLSKLFGSSKSQTPRANLNDLANVFTNTWYSIKVENTAEARAMWSASHDAIEQFFKNPSVPEQQRTAVLTRINTVIGARAGQQKRMGTIMDAITVKALSHMVDSLTKINPDPHLAIINDTYLFLLEGKAPRLSPEAVTNIIAHLDGFWTSYEQAEISDEKHEHIQNSLRSVYNMLRSATDDTEIVARIDDLLEDLYFDEIHALQTPVNSIDDFLSSYRVVLNNLDTQINGLRSELNNLRKNENNAINKADAAEMNGDSDQYKSALKEYNDITRKIQRTQNRIDNYVNQSSLIDMIAGMIQDAMENNTALPKYVTDFFKNSTFGNILKNAEYIVASLKKCTGTIVDVDRVSNNYNSSNHTSNADVDDSDLQKKLRAKREAEAALKGAHNTTAENNVNGNHKV